MQVIFFLLLLASYKVILRNSLCKNTFELIVKLMHLFSLSASLIIALTTSYRTAGKKGKFSATS